MWYHHHEGEEGYGRDEPYLITRVDEDLREVEVLYLEGGDLVLIELKTFVELIGDRRIYL
jgi:hypothetical protein